MWALRRAARLRPRSRRCARASRAPRNDPEFVDDAIKRNGVPFTFVNVPRGQAIFRSLADVTPQVLATVRASIAAPN